MVECLEQLAVDDVRFDLVRNQLEQRAQAGAGVGNIFQAAEHFLLFEDFPTLKGGLQQGIARREMPVEAALGDAQPARQRLHGDRAHALFGDQVKRGLCPIVRAEAVAATRNWRGVW